MSKAIVNHEQRTVREPIVAHPRAQEPWLKIT